MRLRETLQAEVDVTIRAPVPKKKACNDLFVYPPTICQYEYRALNSGASRCDASL